LEEFLAQEVHVLHISNLQEKLSICFSDPNFDCQLLVSVPTDLFHISIGLHQIDYSGSQQSVIHKKTLKVFLFWILIPIDDVLNQS